MSAEGMLVPDKPEAVNSCETSLCCPLVVFRQRKRAIQPGAGGAPAGITWLLARVCPLHRYRYIHSWHAGTSLSMKSLGMGMPWWFGQDCLGS